MLLKDGATNKSKAGGLCWKETYVKPSSYQYLMFMFFIRSSQRKIKSSVNMNFPETSLRHQSMTMNLAPAEATGEVGLGVVGVVEVVVKGEVAVVEFLREIVLGKIRTRRDRRIITGNVGMIRRWPGLLLLLVKYSQSYSGSAVNVIINFPLDHGLELVYMLDSLLVLW